VAGRGRLIAIEGIDGSGKGTQAARLVDALRAGGKRVELISFPRYRDTFFGERIGDFLNGRFGSLADVHPFLAAVLFAGDRLESRALLEECLRTNDVVILDRYVASNVAHQASKRTGIERSELIEWIERLEFEVNRLPRPDGVVLLDLPATEAQKLIARKAARSYTQKSADLQEADTTYLENVRQVYLQLASNGTTWSRIPVLKGGAFRSIDEIAADVKTLACVRAFGVE
jgi:dTMP kinase